VSRLRSDQQALRRETQTTQSQTLGKSLRDLVPTEVASLRRLGQRQTELSRQFDKLIGRMAAMESQLAESQPLAAETVADALDAAKRLAISSQMMDASRELERNQLGSAGQQQDEIADSLSQLLDVLSNRTEHELERRLKQLREASTELADVQRQLERLERSAKAAAAQADPQERKRQLERLTKEHQRLAEEAQRLARRLERLQASEAGPRVATRLVRRASRANKATDKRRSKISPKGSSGSKTRKNNSSKRSPRPSRTCSSNKSPSSNRRSRDSLRDNSR
jgi:chromosome segregation ATPase